MTSFLFAILSSAGIFVCFKYLEKFRVDILLAIIINYIVASSCGFILSNTDIKPLELIHQEWFSLSILIGIAFIAVFFIIGKSTQKAGISITTLASKMSFVIPMLFSILYYGESVSIKKVIGFILAISAVLLSIYKEKQDTLNQKYLWLPILLFVGAGTVDSLLKFAQEEYLSSGGKELFSSLLFAIAAVSGLIVLIIRKGKINETLKCKTVIGGVVLGLFNYGSLYFLIASLNHSGFDGSIVFSIINIGIVALSVLTGIGIFRERLNKINVLGIILAFIAIFILAN